MDELEKYEREKALDSLKDLKKIPDNVVERINESLQTLEKEMEYVKRISNYE